MGTDKAMLPFGPCEVMLQRVVRLICTVMPTERICCAAAVGQRLPKLPSAVRVVRDRRPECGPMEGLAIGLAAMHGKVDAVYVTSCDVPLLVPAFVQRMFEMLGSEELAMPQDGKFFHPLAAVYRLSLLEIVERRLAEGQFRLASLVEECQTRAVSIDQLREVDPELLSLVGCNCPVEYQRALQRAGFVEGGEGE